MRTCKKCGVEKPDDAFSGKRYTCKPCMCELQQARYRADPQRWANYAAEWAARPENREKRLATQQRYRDRHRRAIQDKDLRKRYGITLEQYEAMFEAQRGRCAICQRDKKLHVDHCHATGKVRGLLCSQCNKGLGHFEDSLARLRAAEVYLVGLGALLRSQSLA